MPDSAFDGHLGKRADRIRCPGDRQIRVGRHVRGARAAQRRRPRVPISPVERWLARARAESNGQTASLQPLRDASARLARRSGTNVGVVVMMSSLV